MSDGRGQSAYLLLDGLNREFANKVSKRARLVLLAIRQYFWIHGHIVGDAGLVALVHFFVGSADTERNMDTLAG